MMSKRFVTTTSTTQNSIVSFDMNDKGRILDSLGAEIELEKLDREAGHQYISMDIYVDSTTIKEHFQASSIRNRWLTKHQHSS
jgi:hypothetical protein